MNINFIQGTINNELVSLNKELSNTYYKIRNYISETIDIDIYERFVSLENNILTIQDRNSYEYAYRTVTIDLL